MCYGSSERLILNAKSVVKLLFGGMGWLKSIVILLVKTKVNSQRSLRPIQNIELLEIAIRNW